MVVTCDLGFGLVALCFLCFSDLLFAYIDFRVGTFECWVCWFRWLPGFAECLGLFVLGLLVGWISGNLSLNAYCGVGIIPDVLPFFVAFCWMYLWGLTLLVYLWFSVFFMVGFMGFSAIWFGLVFGLLLFCGLLVGCSCS